MCQTVAVSEGGGFGEVVQDGSSGDPKHLGAWPAMGDVAVALFVSEQLGVSSTCVVSRVADPQALLFVHGGIPEAQVS